MFVLLDGGFEALGQVLEDSVDVLLVHVGGFYLGFGLWGGHLGGLLSRIVRIGGGVRIISKLYKNLLFLNWI